MSKRNGEERRHDLQTGPGCRCTAAGLPSVPAIFLLLLILLAAVPTAAQQPAPLTQGIPVIPAPARPARTPLPPGAAPSDAMVDQAKETALAYLRCMAGGVLPDAKACEAYLHPDAVWPRSDSYALLLVLPELRVVDVGVVPKTVNLWKPEVEFVVSVVVQAEVIGRISQLLAVKERTGTARRTIDLIMQDGQFRVIDMDRPMLRWAFPEAAAAWAGVMQGRNPEYREVRTRIEALAGRNKGTAR